MSLLTGIRRGLRALLQRGAVTREVDDEIAAHLAFETEALVAQGVAPDEAARRARLTFGNLQRVRERAFEERRFAWFDDFLRDLGQSWRQLRRTPFATLALVLTAATGIAGITTAFSIANAMWFRPLPYERDGELHGLQVLTPKRYFTTWLPRPVADSVRQLVRVASRPAFFVPRQARIELPDSAAIISVTHVDSALFSLMHITPRSGRSFTPDEYASGAPVVILTPGLWAQLPRAARDADTARVELNGVPHRVIGVMAQRERFHERGLAWVPLHDSQPEVLLAMRRAPGVSADSLEELLADGGQMRVAGADTGVWRVEIAPLYDRGHKGPVYVMMFLFAVVMALLAVATASNVATQLVARAERRKHELATSAALGATTERLARRLLADQFIVGVMAGILGTLGSVAGIQLFVARLDTRGFPGWITFEVDWRILGFAILATAWLIGAIGVLPVKVGARLDLVLSMREAGTIGVTSRGSKQATSRLLAIQVALSLALVTVSAVTVQAYRDMTGIEQDEADRRRFDIFAFSADGGPSVDSARLTLYDSLARILPESHRARTALHGGVRGIHLGTALATTDLTADATGPAWRPPNDRPVRLYAPDDTTQPFGGRGSDMPNVYAAESAYVALDGRRLVTGRLFTEADASADSVPVLVTSDLARAVWGDAPAVGRALRIGRDGPPATIVGVITPRTAIRGDREGLRIATQKEIVLPRSRAILIQPRLRVEATAGLEATRSTASAAARRIDRRFSIPLSRSISEENALNLLPIEIMLAVLGGAALLVGGIALLGLHGLASQASLARRSEIGIRVALGATERQVVRMVIRDSLRSTLNGLIAGLALSVAALAAFRLIVPFEVRDILLPTLLAMLGFAAVVLFTCWLPARRAARIAPAEVLRSI